jgi:hypothetical protein
LGEAVLKSGSFSRIREILLGELGFHAVKSRDLRALQSSALTALDAEDWESFMRDLRGIRAIAREYARPLP